MTAQKEAYDKKNAVRPHLSSGVTFLHTAMMKHRMGVCDVCVNRTAAHFPCGRCAFDMCRECTRRCVIECGREEDACGACPNCAREWDTEELVARVGALFWKTTFRAMRRTQLFQRELPRLEDTRDAAEHERVRLQLRHASRDLWRRVQRGAWHLTPDLHAAQHALRQHVSVQPGIDAFPGRWSRRCECGGILGTDGACVTCSRHTCLRCGAVRTDGHVCDEAAVASLETIARECRPCVRCRAPSLRQEGCTVMWCPHCLSLIHI